MRLRERKPDGIDAWIEEGLARGLNPLLAWNAGLPAGRYMTTVPKRARRPQRLLLGGASALVLTAGAAMGVAAATTGSFDTAAWGRQVSSAVETCRVQLPEGARGVGPCVGAIASHKAGAPARVSPGKAGGANANPTAGGGSAPGKSGSAPGHGGTAPGNSGSAPGHGGTPPGNSGSAPGHSGSAPGNSGSAPGHGATPPGNSGSAPGHGGSPPPHK